MNKKLLLKSQIFQLKLNFYFYVRTSETAYTVKRMKDMLFLYK